MDFFYYYYAAVLFVFGLMFGSFLNALLQTGVGVCGGPVIKPLAGRTEAPGPRN